MVVSGAQPRLPMHLDFIAVAKTLKKKEEEKPAPSDQATTDKPYSCSVVSALDFILQKMI